MAALTAASSSLLFTSSSNLRSRNSLISPSGLSTASASPSLSLSSSFSTFPSFLPYPTISGSRRAPRSSFTVNASGADKKKVLIINTDSGGHAVIGFYFAKELLAKGHEVTILTWGDDEGSAKMKKPPFNRFSEIVSAGGKTVWGEPPAVEGSAFDVVLDNHGKDLETVGPVIDWANEQGAEQFLYISSAGIYKPTDEQPHVEGDPVNVKASHYPVERYIAQEFTSWAIFRPQYMIGSGNNKDCEEWFFDRIVRGRPVPIPGSGLQLTNISHVRDLSSMLTKAVENPVAASGKIFNAVSDRAVTLDGMAKLCAKVAGLPVEILHYDPKFIGSDAKIAFPFRNMHFYAEPRAAKDILGWESSTNLPEDLKERFEEYVKSGRDKKPMEFPIDDKIFLLLKVPVPVTV